MSESTSKPVLSIRDLVVEFKTEAGVIRALDGVSFEVGRERRSASSASPVAENPSLRSPS